MRISFFIIVILFSFIVFMGCDSSEGTEIDDNASLIDCETLSDCPRGYVCGNDFYCVLGDETEGNPVYEEEVDEDVAVIITDSNDAYCTVSSDCSSDKICQYRQCINPFDKIWKISEMKVSLNTDKVWDLVGAGGNAVQPDPMVIIYVNGKQILETDAASDTFIASFIDSVDITFSENDSLVIEIRDADIIDFRANYDKAGTISYNPIPVSIFRAQVISESNFEKVVRFSAKFEPAN